MALPLRTSFPIAVAAMLTVAATGGAQTPAPDSAARPATVLAKPTVPKPNEEREFAGAYSTGFEMSWFEPCDAPTDDSIWWVTLTGDALAQRDSLLAAIPHKGTNGLAVRWLGTISPRMPAGHMGRGKRYMLVTKVIDIRPLPSGGACSTRIM